MQEKRFFTQDDHLEARASEVEPPALPAAAHPPGPSRGPRGPKCDPRYRDRILLARLPADPAARLC